MASKKEMPYSLRIAWIRNDKFEINDEGVTNGKHIEILNLNGLNVDDDRMKIHKFTWFTLVILINIYDII